MPWLAWHAFLPYVILLSIKQQILKCPLWLAEGGKPKLVLPLHIPQPGSDYFLGMFLGGVYQEVMGSAHNMLGSTHVVQIKVTADGIHCTGDSLAHPLPK